MSVYHPIINQILQATYDKPRHIRAGQAAFNKLHELRPEWAEEIRGKALDPFYDSGVLAVFYIWLHGKIAEENK